MPKPKSRAASSKPTRKLRPRPRPRWLTASSGLEEIAQRRCLLILSVLSGERPVTEAVAEAQMTRALYYQLEKRALLAMLRAVSPGSEAAGSEDSTSSAGRVRSLEEKVARLEKEKRRTERLLFLTRTLIRPGPLKTKAGRKPSPKTTPKSAASSKTTRTKASPTKPTASTLPLTQTPVGGTES